MESRVGCPLDMCIFSEFVAPVQASQNGFSRVRRDNDQDAHGVREKEPDHAERGIVTAAYLLV